MLLIKTAIALALFLALRKRYCLIFPPKPAVLTIATSALHFKPSITVKANTQMFDTTLHSLTGIDVGIMQVSLYELIPFRIYVTVGTILATDTTHTSTIDRSQAPVIIEGRQHAMQLAWMSLPLWTFGFLLKPISASRAS